MRDLLIQLNLISGLGSPAVAALVETFPDLGRFLGADPTEAANRLGVEPERVIAWFAEARKRPAQREESCARSIGASVVTRVDSGYPRPLYETVGAPIVLYARGDWVVDDEPGVAVVGSRRPTPYGRQVATRIGRRLAESGLTVVSGMARGVDSEAHRGALAAGGRTIAVLGCGIDRCYPPGHERLAQEIAASGAVLSEFPLGTVPAPFHFPQRNRIISGLARAVVVVEAAQRSGSLITARLALEQGRDVFAVPGPITSGLSRGAHRLLDEGASLLQDVDDVIESLGRTPGIAAGAIRAELSADEQRVFDCVGATPVPIDRIVADTGMTAERVASLLTTLELKDRIRDVGAGRVVGLDG